MKEDSLSIHYGKKLKGEYDCVDRIVLNGYMRSLQIGGGFRNWYRDFNGDDSDLNNARLMRMAGKFSRRLYSFCKSKGIPVINSKSGERKHDIAKEYLPTEEGFTGLFLVIKNRASASIWDVKEYEHGIHLEKKYSFVNHYFFHIMDKQWGHVTIRMCSHPPFNCMIILNGHEFTGRKLRKKSIAFEKTDNCFTAYEDGGTLSRVADTCTKGHLENVCRRWVSSCLWFAIDYETQKRTYLHYDYSIYQVEYSRNLLFKRGAEMDRVYQGIIDLTRSNLDVERIKTLFGKKRRPSKSGNSAMRVCIEKPDYNLTVFKIHFEALTLKLYDKGERTLRAEVVVHNTKDLKCKRGLDQFEIIRKKLGAMMVTFLSNLLYVHTAFIEPDALQRLTQGKRRKGQVISGINPFKQRDIRIMHAVMAVGFKPEGFSSSDVAQKLTHMYGLTLKATQVAYVLRKLKARKIVTAKKGKRKYHLTSDGLQTILAITTVTEQQLPKMLACRCVDGINDNPMCKDQYHQAYFQLKRSIKAFADLSPVKLVA